MRERLPDWAGDYVGLPFLERGRDRAGLDCWGLVRLALKEQFGIEVPSYTGEYQDTEDGFSIGAAVRRESAAFWQAVGNGFQRCGDVIVLRMRGQPMHVGLVLTRQCMLHVQQGVGATVEMYDGVRWKNRIAGFYRHGAARP